LIGDVPSTAAILDHFPHGAKTCRNGVGGDSEGGLYLKVGSKSALAGIQSYHRRSLAETAMYRMKCCFGDHLKNREVRNQRTESRIRGHTLHRFIDLGLPQFEWD
jgi:hypothetical protein